MKNAIVYRRKSTDESGNQILSLITQKRITDLLAIYHGLTVVADYEEARSAKVSGNRPVFTKMLSEIRDGKAEYIVVAHADRLARNERELADITEMVEQGLIKGVVMVKERIHSTVDDIHELTRDLVEASYFSKKLSERVKEGNETKRQRGEFTTRAPIGYINKDGKIYPDPKYADYVKMVFTLYAEGSYTIKELANHLFDRGMRSRITGNKIPKSVIYEILTNPICYGVFRSHGSLYKGIHEPLITKELFDLVQDVLNGKNVRGNQKQDFLYRGYLKCGICGCSYTASMKKQIHKYYYCTNSKGVCSQHLRYLKEARVFELLRDLVRPFSAVEGAVAQLAYETYVHDTGNKTASGISIREQIGLQLQEADGKLKRLLDLLLDNKIDDMEYERKKKEVAENKMQLELQLRNFKPISPDEKLDKLERFREKAVSIYSMFLDDDRLVREDVLKSLLWNASVVDGIVMSQQYKLPWSLMEKPLKTGEFRDWYP